MQVSEIKQQLHEAITTIKDETYLQVLLTILTTKQESSEEAFLTKEQIQLLREREEKYKSGQSKALSLTEFRKEMNRELRMK